MVWHMVWQALDDLAQEVIWLNEHPRETPTPAPAAATAATPTPPPTRGASTTCATAAAPSSVTSHGRTSVASRFVPAAATRGVRGGAATPLQTQLDQAKAGGCTVKLWRMGDVGATAPKPLYKVKKSYRHWDQVCVLPCMTVLVQTWTPRDA